MNLYTILKYAHSGFRYVVLVLLLSAIISAWVSWLGKKPYGEGIRKLNLFTLISVHIQLLLGLVLYFLSPFVQFTKETMKHDDTRYWTVEHITGMIVAIILITVGHSFAKRMDLPAHKHRAIALSYTIGFIIIIAIIVSGHLYVFGRDIDEWFKRFYYHHLQ
jgi:hypothetical protein